MHVRDGASADEDLREALQAQALALGAEGAARARCCSPATAAARTCSTFPTTTRPRSRTPSACPPAGFFCAGEIGPVGGRNFLHGFTATIAVFPRAG